MAFKSVLVLLFISAATYAAQKSYFEHKLVQVNLDERNHDVILEFTHKNKIDVWTKHPHAGHPLNFLLCPDGEKLFHTFATLHKIKYEILIEDVGKVFDAERSSQLSAKKYSSKDGITFDRYYSHDEINQYLDDLSQNYPNMVTIENIGSSHEGRKLNVIKISQNPSANNPIIFIDAGIHAREWIAPALSLYIINQLVENSTNIGMTSNLDWHILPSLNPDGYEYSQSDDRLWRKTRSQTVDPDCIGVDANRNFGFHWNEVGASDYPCDEDYAGTEAFSEVEAQALRDYILKIGNSAKLYLTLHSYGEYFLYPWGYTSDLPDDYKTLDDLARKANQAQIQAGGDPFTVGSSTCVLYAAAGGSDDWAKGVGGVSFSYTIEMPGGGDYGFDLPASEIRKTVTTFFPAIQVFGEYFNKKN